eukprot:379035-Ditylum_brightwellii.AAC.1
MVIFSKLYNTVKPQDNGPQELKSIIPIECPKVGELTKGNCHTYKLGMIPYNANLLMHNLAIPFSNTGSVEE